MRKVTIALLLCIGVCAWGIITSVTTAYIMPTTNPAYVSGWRGIGCTVRVNENITIVGQTSPYRVIWTPPSYIGDSPTQTQITCNIKYETNNTTIWRIVWSDPIRYSFTKSITLQYNITHGMFVLINSIWTLISPEITNICSILCESTYNSPYIMVNGIAIPTEAMVTSTEITSPTVFGITLLSGSTHLDISTFNFTTNGNMPTPNYIITYNAITERDRDVINITSSNIGDASGIYSESGHLIWTIKNGTHSYSVRTREDYTITETFVLEFYSIDGTLVERRIVEIMFNGMTPTDVNDITSRLMTMMLQFWWIVGLMIISVAISVTRTVLRGRRDAQNYVYDRGSMDPTKPTFMASYGQVDPQCENRDGVYMCEVKKTQ